MTKKHLAGDVQRSWVAGEAKHPPPRVRLCPACGEPMTHWKRYCSVECYEEIQDYSSATGKGEDTCEES